MRNHSDDDRYEWLALHLVQGLGNVVFKNLLEGFGSPRNILKAGISDLMNVSGIREDVARKIVRKEFVSDPSKTLKRLEALHVRVDTYADPSYPPALREIHDPPMVLYIKGRDILPRAVFIAVVGSRNPTPYGLKAAEKIGQGLARRGVGVVSGLARGIDSAAHWGSLGGRGFTAAV
ncbi:MAG: DNA-processing protein DprA, partial [Proteobacteria bacterium]|nr:DNA-processing protein DprA [Pseudomonadota bacterium]